VQYEVQRVKSYLKLIETRVCTYIRLL